MVPIVETMRRFRLLPSSVSMTERGLRWFVLGLIVALAAGLLSLLLLFTVIAAASWSPFFLVEDAAGLVVIVLGLLGFWTVRRGRAAHGMAHTSSLRRAMVALVLTAVSEALIFVSGIVLGYGILPHAIIVGGTYPPAITPEWILRMVHFSGYIFVSIFVGLFLLWTIWHLDTGVPRAIAVVALVVGVPTHVISLLTVSFLLDPLPVPVTLYRVAFVLPALSMLLWLIAYLLVILQLRSHAMTPVPSAVSN